MPKCKLKVNRGPITIQRGTDNSGEHKIIVGLATEVHFDLSLKMNHKVPLNEAQDLKWLLEEFSPEGQEAIKTLISECEKKVLAKARPKAAEMLADLGMSLED